MTPARHNSHVFAYAGAPLEWWTVGTTTLISFTSSITSSRLTVSVLSLPKLRKQFLYGQFHNAKRLTFPILEGLSQSIALKKNVKYQK